MNTQQVSVGNTATQLLDATTNSSSSYPQSAVIENPAGGVNVFIGGSGVTTATGFLLAGGQSLSLDLVNDKVFGIVSAGTQTVYVISRY